MKNWHRTNVTNVLVVGSGGAGLRAAIAAHEMGAEVVVVGKRLRKEAHPVLTAGGINAALGTVDPEDSWEQHFADTLKAGYFLGNPAAVEILTREAPEVMDELVEWGCKFNRTRDGELDQRFFGAHAYRRTCYAGDFTGREIINALLNKVEEFNIPIIENQYVSRLLIHNDVCFGAMAFDIQTGERTVFLADAVILAGRGSSRIWRRSSSRWDENTGDGIYLALEAGCRVADMELVQFHPTGMVWPENMELSTRDTIALANDAEIQAGRGSPNGGVSLDISHKDKKMIIEKLPQTYRQFLETQFLDISMQQMEVAPTAHYAMGGVMVDPELHTTDVDGLYAAGEVTSGVHGANRLAGNSLTEILVFGRRAGWAAAEYSLRLGAQIRNQSVIQGAHQELNSIIKPGDELARPLQRALRDNMWENCGVIRDEARLRKGLDNLEAIKNAAQSVDVRPDAEGFQALAVALDLKGSIIAAEATIRSALARKESRGAHQRADFPHQSPTFDLNIQVYLNDGKEQIVTTRRVEPVPARLYPWVEGLNELAVAGRLLE